MALQFFSYVGHGHVRKLFVFSGDVLGLMWLFMMGSVVGFPEKPSSARVWRRQNIDLSRDFAHVDVHSVKQE